MPLDVCIGAPPFDKGPVAVDPGADDVDDVALPSVVDAKAHTWRMLSTSEGRFGVSRRDV